MEIGSAFRIPPSPEDYQNEGPIVRDPLPDNVTIEKVYAVGLCRAHDARTMID
jgi:hypothetical protein